MALAEGVGSKWAVGLDGKGYMVTTLDQESPFEYRAFTQQAVPLRTPRIDTSPEPGEASLGDLWVRSQHDWSRGMGQDVFDGENSERNKVRDLVGFDPFIEPHLKSSSKYTLLESVGDWQWFPHGDLIYGFNGTTVKRYDENWTSESITITAPFGDNLHNIVADNENFYYATATGIYKILVTDTFGSWVETEVKVNDLTNCTVLEFGKGRLVACKGNDIHVIDDLTSLISGATAQYIHMDSSWTWSDADELGQGFYISGHSGSESKLYLMSFDTTDASAGLTIGIPREVWRASSGEKILCVEAYAGSALLIGTNKGVRNVVVVDRDGNVVVGPLIETAQSHKVKDIAIWGRYAFFFYGVIAHPKGNRIAIAKLDLSTFSLAAPYSSPEQADAIDGTSVCIPPWYDEYQSPVIAYDGGFPRSWRSGKGPSSASMFSGIIRVGTSVNKELRRLELVLDPGAFALVASTTTVGATITQPQFSADPYDFIFKMRMDTWIGAAGGQTLFLQGVSDSDYRWRIRIDDNRYLIFQYKDNTDVIRIATSTVALPDFDKEDQVWTRIYKIGSFIVFEYWMSGLNSKYPGGDDWVRVDLVNTGSGNDMKLEDGTIHLLFDPITALDGLNTFDIYTEDYLTLPETREIAFRAYEYEPDLEGNTWVLGTSIMSGYYNLYYNSDSSGWKALHTSTETTTRYLSLVFPSGTEARQVEILFAVFRNTKWYYNLDLLEWRLLAEPIPTPRYFRYYVPIMLYDNMATLDGHRNSRPGYALEYLEYLETLYRNGTAFDFQKPSGYLEPTVSTRVRIEDMEFKDFAPPKGASGFGGIALVVLKEIAT